MRIGLLVLSVGNFGKKGFYNLQEVGLARELDSLFDEVLVYRLVDRHSPAVSEPLEGCRGTSLTLLPSGQWGSNGIPPLDKLDDSIDILICFSDTQLFFPSVYRWCTKHHIRLFPYIGVIKSHSTSRLKQWAMGLFRGRDLAVYKKLTCLAKTPDVKDELTRLGVRNVLTAPVGLDMAGLKNDCGSLSAAGLKKKYGFAPEDKIILFIGRMTAEKQPLLMVDIFRAALQKNPSYRLLMVGTGELSDEVSRRIDGYGLNEKVTRFDRIPNSDIWELYRVADCLVNLNRQEIYGMVLLEAMYYGCKVIAWHAPGPDYIIKDGVTGYLADSDEKICELILDSQSVSEQARAAIISDFSWKKTACIIGDLAKSKEKSLCRFM